MKKLLLLLTLFVASMSFKAAAEIARFEPCLYVDDNWVYTDDIYSEITADEDEIYFTVTDFLGSGKELEFKKATSPSYIDGNKARLQITQAPSKSYNGTSCRYLELDGERYQFVLPADTVVYTTVRARYTLNIKSSYLEEYTETEAQSKGCRYHGYFELRVVLPSDEEPVDGDSSMETWLDVDFYFGEVEVEQFEFAGSEDITLNIYAIEDNAYVSYAKSQATTLEKYVSDKSTKYTIKDFLGSGSDIDFTFEAPEAGEEATMTILSNYGDDTYPYFYANDDYLTANLESLDGESNIELDWLYYDPDATVLKYTESEAARHNAKYYGSLYFVGYDDNGWTDWLFLDFYFNGDSTSSGVIDTVINNSNAPVEYYNLSGIRVENPANGIYICKQGNNVKKVIIK